MTTHGPYSSSEQARVTVECRRALGWSAERIADVHGIPLRHVLTVFVAQDNIADVDLFDTAPHAARHARCYKGHLFTPKNTYQRPNGNRECRTCKNARKAAAA